MHFIFVQLRSVTFKSLGTGTVSKTASTHIYIHILIYMYVLYVCILNYCCSYSNFISKEEYEELQGKVEPLRAATLQLGGRRIQP